jgi:hypothetical protein
MQMVAGVILGAGGGARKAVSDRKQKAASGLVADALANRMNQYPSQGLIDWVSENPAERYPILRNTALSYRAVNGSRKAQSKIDEAIANGDFKHAKDAEFMAIFNHMKSRIDANHYDDMIKEFDGLYEGDLAGFRRDFGYDDTMTYEETDKRLREVKQSFKDYAKVVKKSVDKVNKFFMPDFTNENNTKAHDYLVYLNASIDNNINRRNQAIKNAQIALTKAGKVIDIAQIIKDLTNIDQAISNRNYRNA